MERMTAESTQDLFEYMARKIDRGTTWEQLAKKLDDRGMFISHFKTEVLFDKLFHEAVRDAVSDEIYTEFRVYVSAVDSSFGSDNQIYAKLIAKLDYLAAASRKQGGIEGQDGIKEQIDLLKRIVNDVFDKQEEK